MAAEGGYSSDEDLVLSPLVGRRIYLVTCSGKDATRFESREVFGNALMEEFNHGDAKAKVEYLAVSREPHKQQGYHYHASVKLTGCKKWKGVKARLCQKYGVNPDFRGNYNLYRYAYKYIAKTDKNVYHSQGHPSSLLLLEPGNSPVTKQALAARNEKRKQRLRSSGSTPQDEAGPSHRGENRTDFQDNAPTAKKPRMTNVLLSKFIKESNVKSYDELLYHSQIRLEAGYADVNEFIFSRKQADLCEVIKKTWEIENIKAVMLEKSKKRMDYLEDCLRKPCVEGCDEDWIHCAVEVLHLNKIPIATYATAMKEAIIKGRGKRRNIFLAGEQDCAKTFMLEPLKAIFGDKLFQNPTNHKYSWWGADKAICMLWNDFRFNRDMITWDNLLRLLEGDSVKLPAPKNIQVEDITISSDVAIFATGKEVPTYKGTYNSSCGVESAMMRVRWKVFNLTHIFPEEVQKDVPPCPKCFSFLVTSDW